MLREFEQKVQSLLQCLYYNLRDIELKDICSDIFLQVMTLILIGTALIFCAIFYIGTKEPSDELGNATMSNAADVNIVVSFLNFYYNIE